MRVFLLKLSGEKFALDYDPSSDTVQDIKLAVEEEWKIEPAKQRLLFGGQILKDDKHIQFYNVPEDAVIQVAPMAGADPAEPPQTAVPKGILKNTAKANDDEEEEEEQRSSDTHLQRNSSSTSASSLRQSSSSQSSRPDRRSAPTRPRNKMDKKESRIRDEVDELRDVTATWTRAFEREHNRKPTPKDLPKDIAVRFKKLFELEEILKIEYGG